MNVTVGFGLRQGFRVGGLQSQAQKIVLSNGSNTIASSIVLQNKVQNIVNQDSFGHKPMVGKFQSGFTWNSNLYVSKNLQIITNDDDRNKEIDFSKIVEKFSAQVVVFRPKVEQRPPEKLEIMGTEVPELLWEEESSSTEIMRPPEEEMLQVVVNDDVVPEVMVNRREFEKLKVPSIQSLEGIEQSSFSIIDLIKSIANRIFSLCQHLSQRALQFLSTTFSIIKPAVMYIVKRVAIVALVILLAYIIFLNIPRIVAYLTGVLLT